MFKKSVVLILILLFGLASFSTVMAQDELPIAEEDFLNAELLVVYCFNGLENYYAYLNAETAEDEYAVLVDDVGLTDELATSFITDIDALSEELGEDIDVVTAKSYFYAAVIVHCFGEEGLATVPEADGPEYYIIYFELDEDASSYFYYLYEETYYYMSIEVYLIDVGVDPAYFDMILFLLDDPEALDAYFVEIGIEIDIDVFYSDLEVLEADAEDDYTEDEAYVEEEDEDADDDGIADEDDEDDDGDGTADEEDEDDDGDGIDDEEDEDDNGGEDDSGDDDGGDDEGE